MSLEELKKHVCRLNQELPRQGLVTMTSGNVSGWDFESGLVVIKPSGVPFEELTPEAMSVVSLEGDIVEGPYKPSVDTPTHCYVYRHRPDVGGIVHTHSPYATAFAAAGRPIPVYLTAAADEFGGPIPLGDFRPIGDEEIGEEIVRSIGSAPAILMKNHGVFAVGPTPEGAFKAAVMCEDIARTSALAELLGKPEELPPDIIARLHKRYKTKYGQ